MSNPTPAHSLVHAFQALPVWWSSFGYLKQKKLRYYHAAGPLVVLGLAAAGISFSKWLTQTLKTAFHQALDRANWAGEIGVQTSPTSWWNEALLWCSHQADWIIEWGVIIVVLWLKVKVTKYLLITLMAPAMSALASAVKSEETGTATPFLWSGLLRDIGRGIRISAVLFLMELALGLTLSLVGLLLTVFAGPIGVLAGPFLLIGSWTAGAYFFGAAVYDAVYEQDGLTWKASLSAGWSQRGHLLGLGAIFSVIIAIPWAGPYLAAILGPVPCTTAAARLYFRRTSVETT